MVISMAGDFDVQSSPTLEAVVAACFAENPARMIFDLSTTEFLASSGISVLVSACAQAGDTGIGFGVVADAPSTSRPIKLLQLDKALNLHPSLDEVQASLEGAP